MGRRRKGRNISGWLVVDKPQGPSSTDIVNRIRNRLNASKAGHAGTLDPQATGVLVIGFGDATKIIAHITDALKAYHFTLRFGAATNTDDSEGEIIAQSDKRPTNEEIAAALTQFRGQIEQVPPNFSAVKLGGERAYNLARAGAALTLSARPLWVEKIAPLSRADADHLELEFICGKGGYVRAIARDLGQTLGCYAHVRQLRRVWSGPFDVKDAITPEQIDGDHETLEAALLPFEHGLRHLPELPCSAVSATRIANGNPGEVLSANGAAFGDLAWASHQGRAVAIGTYRAGMLDPTRVFQRSSSR